MIFSRRFDGSVCGTRVLRRPSPRRSSPGPAAFAGSTGYQACASVPKEWRRFVCAAASFSQLRPLSTSPSHDLGCRCSKLLKSCLLAQRATSITTRRYGHTQAAATVADKPAASLDSPSSNITRLCLPPPNPPSKEELLAIVGQYVDDDTVQAHLEFWKDPFLRGYAPANDREVAVSSRRDDFFAPSPQEATTPNERERWVLKELQAAVLTRLRNPLRSSPERIYELYCKLPEPRMSYITGTLRHQLLHALGMTEKKNAKSMLRYFTVIADVKACGFPLLVAEWNSAIAFAARQAGTITEAEVEVALNIWREMEQEAGLRSNEVTFNILFDVASKAGNFALAEMVFQEMEHRNIWFNRYHHVTLIYFFGLKMDGDGVRAAYKEMVEAGEIIDQVALNCVITALLKCGEEDAALRVYERMKSFNPDAASIVPRELTTQKAITKVMMMFARVGQKHPAMRQNFQGGAHLQPDLTTYRVLVRHFAIKLGKIDQVAKYLNEMKFFQIPVHGAIFLSLFKAFALHGRGVGGGARGGGSVYGSDWSQQRLFGVWEALLHALDNGSEGLYIETWLAIWVLRAFEQCGCKEMLVDIYGELAARWQLDKRRAEFMARFLYNMLKRLNLKIPVDRNVHVPKLPVRHNK